MKKRIYNLLTLLFALVFAVSAGFLIHYYWESYRQQSRYDDLAQLVESATVPRPTPTQPDEPEATQPPQSLVQISDPETGEPIWLLPHFAQLYGLNNHTVGWLSIPGTQIHYPVMQTPKDPNYYLTHNFDRESSSRGCLYAQENCSISTPSDNIILYGHRMRDGSMFARLDAYMDAGFCRDNPYIYFDTLTELHTYQVMAVFLTTATQGEGFSYHTFVEAATPGDFDAFVASCKELSLYDTGVTAQYGDKLITLSTCEYSQDNGRLVMVAKRIV